MQRRRGYTLTLYPPSPQPSRFRGNDTQAGHNPLSSAPTLHAHTRAIPSSPRFALLGRVRMSSPTALTRFTLESLLCRGSSAYNSRAPARALLLLRDTVIAPARLDTASFTLLTPCHRVTLEAFQGELRDFSTRNGGGCNGFRIVTRL